MNTEKNVLAQENLVIKEFLASQSIDVQLESMSMGGPAAPIEDFSWLGDAEVDIRLDADIGKLTTSRSMLLYSSARALTRAGRPRAHIFGH